MLALFEVIVLEPVKLTGAENVRGLAPVTVILFPTCMDAALVKERLVSGVVPPTIPAKETTPAVPALKVRAVAPFNALEKLIFAPAAVPPPFVVSNVGAALIVTGPVIVMIPPLVVMLPFTLIAVDPVYVNAPVVFALELCVIVAAVQAKLVKAAVPPTAPVNVVVPVPPATIRA
jgi:hypothetical protein